MWLTPANYPRNVQYVVLYYMFSYSLPRVIFSLSLFVLPSPFKGNENPHFWAFETAAIILAIFGVGDVSPAASFRVKVHDELNSFNSSAHAVRESISSSSEPKDCPPKSIRLLFELLSTTDRLYEDLFAIFYTLMSQRYPCKRHFKEFT